MRTKCVKIEIKSVEQVLAQFVDVVHAIQRGHPPKKKIEGISFASLDAMRRILTPKRLELLHLIREKKPDSVYELAQLARRDIKNVQEDVSLLSRIDLITLRRAPGSRSRLVPRVEYDQLQLQIPVI